MLATKYVSVKITSKNIDWYTSRGYSAIRGHAVTRLVKTEDLTHGSGIRVYINCDCCGKLVGMQYCEYYAHHYGKELQLCLACRMAMYNSGENNPNYKSTITAEERATNRHYNTKLINWAKAVKHRDNYICVKCKKHSRTMEAHHLNGYDNFKEQRLDIENGVTLCHNCHRNFHSIYGLGNNTKEQFEEWCLIDIELNFDGTVPTSRKAYCVETGEIIDNVYIWADKNGLANTHIYNCLNKKSNHHLGRHYYWYDEVMSKGIDAIKKRNSRYEI